MTARFPEEWAVGMTCRGHCFDTGVVMRAVGDRMIIAPPLVVARAEKPSQARRFAEPRSHGLGNSSGCCWRCSAR